MRMKIRPTHENRSRRYVSAAAPEWSPLGTTLTQGWQQPKSALNDIYLPPLAEPASGSPAVFVKTAREDTERSLVAWVVLSADEGRGSGSDFVCNCRESKDYQGRIRDKSDTGRRLQWGNLKGWDERGMMKGREERDVLTYEPHGRACDLRGSAGEVSGYTYALRSDEGTLQRGRPASSPVQHGGASGKGMRRVTRRSYRGRVGRQAYSVRSDVCGGDDVTRGVADTGEDTLGRKGKEETVAREMGCKPENSLVHSSASCSSFSISALLLRLLLPAQNELSSCCESDDDCPIETVVQ